tara:strand:- start:8272 stop:10836 length:2565 start_codon:yes stop_codon:yes gene_type:complete
MIKDRFSNTLEIDRNDIIVSPELFQGRQTKFSSDTVKAIVSKGYYDKSGEPIVVWWDRGKKKFIVISGHSRFEATEQLFKKGQKNLAKMPVKEFLGDRDDAIDYAVLESNRGSTEEGLLSDINAYKRALKRGYNKNELLRMFKPKSKLNKLEKLSKLNIKGKFIEYLSSDQKNSFPYLERNAQWIGELRNYLPALNDSHENELFDWLYLSDSMALKMSKDKLMNEIDKRVNRLDFDPSKPLNMKDRPSSNAYTDPLNNQIKDLQKEIDSLRVKRNKKDVLINEARTVNPSLIPKFQKESLDIQSLIIRKIGEQQKIRSSVGKLEQNTFVDLFSEQKEPVKPSLMNNKEETKIAKLKKALNLPGLSAEEKSIYETALAKLQPKKTPATAPKKKYSFPFYVGPKGEKRQLPVEKLFDLSTKEHLLLNIKNILPRESTSAERKAKTIVMLEKGYKGTIPRRKPIDVEEINGKFQIVDGNSTFNTLVSMGYQKLPFIIGLPSFKAPPVIKKPKGITREDYKGVFGDYDGDGILNVDDPNPRKTGDKSTIEEVKLSDEIGALIDWRKTGEQNRLDFLEKLRTVAQGETDILSRTKTPYSIFNKMRRKMTGGPNQGLTDLVGGMVIFDKHKDIEAFKNKVNDGVLGKVIEFDDYYSSPKAGYMAYHWNIVYKGGAIELQVKSERLKKIAAASHTLYKTGKHSASRQLELSKIALRADKGEAAAAETFTTIEKSGIKEFLTSTTPPPAKAPEKKTPAPTPKAPQPTRASLLKKYSDRSLKLNRAQVLQAAQEFEKVRGHSAKNDKVRDNSKRLTPDHENLIRWMKSPGQFDLIGVDTYKKDSPTSDLKIKKEIFWSRLLKR